MPERDPVSGLLGALIGGSPAVQDHMKKTGQSLDQVLGGLANAANTPPSATRSGSFGDLLGSSMMGEGSLGGGTPRQGGGGDALSALLGGLLGGGMPQSGAPTQSAPEMGGGDAMGALLGGLLGGGMQQGGAPTQGAPEMGGGDAMGALLGGLLGGGMQQGGAPTQGAPAMGGDPMSALLGGLLGGGMQGGTSTSSAMGNNSFLAPIVDAIAAKIGIPPQIAQLVVSFVLSQLMSGQRDPQLAQMLGGRGTVSQKYLRDSGLVRQVAEQTGLDNKTATKSLQQVMQAFATQMGEGTIEEHQRGLQAWLDTM